MIYYYITYKYRSFYKQIKGSFYVFVGNELTMEH